MERSRLARAVRSFHIAPHADERLARSACGYKSCAARTPRALLRLEMNLPGAFDGWICGGACRSRFSTVAKEAMRRSYTSRSRLVSVGFCPLAPLFSNLSAESACRPRIGQLSKDVLCFNQHAGSAPSHSKRGRHLHKESSGTPFENSVNGSSQLSLAHKARLQSYSGISHVLRKPLTRS
ncbi:hypothetical protein B0H14DRAFT_223596 [Mycena olivaceomarginata]|nr:hypothetical protein B0H14DRAFT_223596 [Mycena olivaceomarginata]